MKISRLKKSLLLIHCDINKTIIVSDASSGRGFLSSLNSILSECVFGFYPIDKPINKREANDWIPISLSLESTIKPDLVTFGTYLEDFTNFDKVQRKALKTSFAESGGIGEQYNSYLDSMKEKLKINLPTPSTLSCLAEGYHFILPSFIKFLTYLTSPHVSDRFDCRIIFRTFGSDIAHVATELNAFCQGTHPIFSPFTVPLDQYPCDFTLSIADSSVDLMTSIARSGPSEADITLNFHNEQTQTRSNITGGRACLNHIIKNLLKEESDPTCRRCISIQDDYSYWAAHNEADDAGKLILVYPETLYGYKTAEFIDRDVIYQVLPSEFVADLS